MKQFLLFVTALCAYSTFATAQGIRFVKPVASGTGDGSSWANASADLQAMINAVPPDGVVWVAAGTYKPTTGTDRSISFVMKNDCGIYGGFAGTETLLTQRNFHTNATILSGDIGTPNNNSDNSYHVFNNTSTGLNNTAVLDGFTIRDGNANAGGLDQSGGGMLNYLNVSPAISNCIFIANSASSAGAVFDQSNSNGVFTNCVFASNTATFGSGAGGAFIDDHSSSTLTNCVFVSNTAPNGSGAAIDAAFSNLTATNCTFYGNQAGVSGGAFYISSVCNITLKNCIVWGNTGGSFPQYANNAGSTLTMTYTDIQGGYSGTGNINSDPLFPNTADAEGADNIWGTSDDGLKLTALSPAINGGNNSNIPVGITTDITGAARIQNTTVDMGAYETLVVSSTRYVKTVASGTADGSSWANASADLQAMINASGVGDQVWVAAGTYKPTTTTNRNISFSMKNNCAIYGGFAGTETLLSQRDFHTNATILSGDIGTLNNNTDNSFHVVDNESNGLTSSAVLDGFTIRDGYANIFSGYQSYGGGMVNFQSSPTVSNCIFIANTAQGGGGVSNHSGSYAVFTNCVFVSNTALFAGGAGGALGDATSSSTLNNCLFISNSATSGTGGALNLAFSNLTATNCTFYGNHANLKAGGIYSSNNSNGVFKNCIVWGNTAGTDPQYFLNGGGAITMTYSDIQGGYSGTGNINADPQFANTSDADGADNIYGTSDDGLFINCTSPALNTGINTGVASTDITGNARIQFTTVDMGAYELASLVGVTWYYDGDNDGYYGSTTASCTSPGAGWSLTTKGADCNDNDIFTHAVITWYHDGDGDNYYGATQVSCFQPGAGWYDVSLSGGGDCNDNNTAINPGASEVLNGIDDNCDGQIDEGFIRYVKTVASGTGDGSSWANASADLQAMINAVPTTGQVWVAAGTYKPTTGTDRSISFLMKSDVRIYGGFTGTETLLSQRDYRLQPTVLSGNIGNAASSTDNTLQVVIAENVNANAALDGFIIRDGYGNQGGHNNGCGIHIVNASPTIKNCVVRDNFADETSDRGDGAGMDINDGGSPVIESCIFYNNTTSDNVESGIVIVASNPSFINCVMAANAGGIAAFGATVHITNCTIFNNINRSIEASASTVTVVNSIIRGQEILSYDDAQVTVTYSITPGAYPGNGNFDTDPLFANASDPDGADNIFRTSDDGLIPVCGSPAINNGDNTGVTVPADIAGNARIQQTTVDMGAYEATSSGVLTWYYDGDNDGYYGSTTTACSSPGAGWSLTTLGADCDDNNNVVYQTLNGYVDADGDGYTVGSLISVCSGAALPVGYSATSLGTDCNDNDNTVWETTNFYIDADSDGYDGGIAYNICYDGINPPAGYAFETLGADCDDNNPNVWESSSIYIDNDGDGYTNGAATVCHGATAPAGYSFTTLGSDCDDNNNLVWRSAMLFIDNDGDNYSTGTALVCYGATVPAGYSIGTAGPDCDDNDPNAWRTASFYIDADGDGYDNGSTLVCFGNTIPPGFSQTTLGSDCDDTNGAINPGTVWYKDADNDNYSDGTTQTQCTRPTGYKLATELAATSGDCDDNNAMLKPTTIWYKDADNDNYSDGTTQTQCARPSGYKLATELTATSGDCNDNNAAIKPTTIWYKDADNDNYSDGTTQTQCARPTGYKLASELTAISGDCNDNNAAVNPGAVEICGNGIDDNCNGQVDEGCSICNVTATASYNSISCYGGLSTITVKASGGTAPYQYRLSGGLTFQLYNTFIVGPGTYSITVKDKKGCTKTISGIVITQPAPLTLTLVQKTDVTCRNGTNGKITVNAGGGTAPYSYKLNSGSYGSSGIFQNLKAGSYTVTAKDAKGCYKSISVTIKNGSGKCSSSFSSTSKFEDWFLDAKVSPNPSVNEFTLALSGNSSEPVTIRVVDIYGRTVHQVKGTASQSYKFGKQFAGGFYIVEIIQGEHVKTLKIIKN